jgi:hypothetical protein
MDALDAGPREDRDLGPDLLRQPSVSAPAAARVLAFGVFADDHPVDRGAARQRALDSGKHARGPHIGVLIEALADGQPQSPQGDMVGHVGRADRAEENGVERPQPLESALGNVMPVLEVVVAAPGEVLDVEPESALFLRERIQHLESGCDHLDADAVAGNGGNPVFAHGGGLYAGAMV